MLIKSLMLAGVSVGSFAALIGGNPATPHTEPPRPALYAELPPYPPPMPVITVCQEPPKATYRTVRMRVTACSPEDPQDKAYYAKNGYEGRITRAVAADNRLLPKGTLLSIPGYAGGAWVPVDSAGGSIIRASSRKGIIHIDVKYRTLYSARKWGNQWLTVKIKED